MFLLTILIIEPAWKKMSKVGRCRGNRSILDMLNKIPLAVAWGKSQAAPKTSEVPSKKLELTPRQVTERDLLAKGLEDTTGA